MTTPSNEDLIAKNKRTGIIVLATVFGMIALSFASVPAYQLFCQVTGFGGTTQTAETLPTTILDRDIKIQFNADTGRSMPWEFHPEQRSVTVKLGEQGLTAYRARNPLNKPSSGTALYNVTPLKAGKYFHKIQCFCFDKQTLRGGQDVSMPILFYIDPAMNDDPNLNDVNTITLSYTFYAAESDELDNAMQKFYNEGENTQ